MTTKTLVTADELLRLPRGTARYELVNGELSQMSPSGHVHGKVAARVGAKLVSFVESQGLGEAYAAETGFLLRHDPDTVRAPDAAFVSSATLAAREIPDAGFFPGAPDLAIEVVSPSDAYTEVEQKVSEWLEAGTQVVVVLDPRRKTGRVYRSGSEVLSLGPSDTLSVPELLAGWTVPLSDLFR